MSHRVSVYDVAELAKVSQSTVSRVLNDYPYVKETTRNKVHAAINELGFSPDEIARSLANRKTNTIGLIVENISNPFYSETAHIILREARKYNYEVMMIDTDDDLESFDKAIATLVGKRVEGIIVASIRRDNRSINKFKDKKVPIILYNRKTEDVSNVNYIEVDNQLGAKMAVDYLIKMNHKRIAYISGPDIYSTFNDRLKGYRESMLVHDVKYDESLVYQGDMSTEKIFEFSMDLMQNKDYPSAFFASSDQIALIVMEAAVRSGKIIPKDISLIGFDDINIASNPFIDLSTISQKKDKMASLAVKGLIELIDSNKKGMKPTRVTLLPELIIRNTTDINNS